MATKGDAPVREADGPGEVTATFRAPPGGDGVPRYQGGWLSPEGVAPFLSYVDEDASVNWSAELEALHEEASRTHFIDRWTRKAIIDRVVGLGPSPTIADVGCSTGFLLEDLQARFPQATLVGIDLVAAGLRKVHQRLPLVRLLHADACRLPIEDRSLDAVVSANLLEHLRDDQAALSEMARVLRPGRHAVIVVPAGPSTYDYYDRFLGHERRYARGELASKCARAGLEPLTELHLAGLLYPAFWLVKQRSRRRYGHLQGQALEDRVTADIKQTKDSLTGRVAWRLEDRLSKIGIRFPFGIRSLVVARRPGADR